MTRTNVQAPNSAESLSLSLSFGNKVHRSSSNKDSRTFQDDVEQGLGWKHPPKTNKKDKDDTAVVISSSNHDSNNHSDNKEHGTISNQQDKKDHRTTTTTTPIPPHVYVLLGLSTLSVSAWGPLLELQGSVASPMLQVVWHMSATALFVIPLVMGRWMYKLLGFKQPHTGCCQTTDVRTRTTGSSSSSSSSSCAVCTSSMSSSCTCSSSSCPWPTFAWLVLVSALCYTLVCHGFAVALHSTNLSTAVTWSNSHSVWLLVGQHYYYFGNNKTNKKQQQPPGRSQQQWGAGMAIVGVLLLCLASSASSSSLSLSSASASQQYLVPTQWDVNNNEEAAALPYTTDDWPGNDESAEFPTTSTSAASSTIHSSWWWGHGAALLSAMGGVGYGWYAPRLRCATCNLVDFGASLLLVSAACSWLLFFFMSSSGVQSCTWDWHVQQGILFGWMSTQDWDRLPLELVLVVVCHGCGVLGYWYCVPYFQPPAQNPQQPPAQQPHQQLCHRTNHPKTSLVLTMAALSEPLLAQIVSLFVSSYGRWSVSSSTAATTIPWWSSLSTTWMDPWTWVGNVMVWMGTYTLVVNSSPSPSHSSWVRTHPSH